MPYRFLEDAFTADIGFVASGATLEECFAAAAEATLEVMLANRTAVQRREQLHVHVEAEALDLLLLKFLEELIYHKDAEQLLLQPVSISVSQQGSWWLSEAVLAGERIDPGRHQLSADVKAVTLHRLSVEWRDGEWEATVVLDV